MVVRKFGCKVDTAPIAYPVLGLGTEQVAKKARVRRLVYPMHRAGTMGAVRVKRFHPRGIGGVVALWGMAGCGQASLLPSEVGQAGEVIHAASMAGAREDLSAWLYLDRAEQELRLARERAGANDIEGARSWAARAWTDAQLS